MANASVTWSALRAGRVRNFLCWSPDDVWAIVNPDADEVPEAIFRAVHVDRPLWVCDGTDEKRERGHRVDALEVLKRFLDPRRRHMQLAIIGKAGTGKSHLVTWLRLQIPEDSNRIVLAIPKAGTSLRDIVGRLIMQLDPDARAPFEGEFQRAGTRTLSRDQQRETLLNNLSVALRGHDADGTLTGDRDLEEHLKEYLPALLHDPHFRNSHFLRPGSFVDEIAEHVFAT
jgi:AAA domain